MRREWYFVEIGRAETMDFVHAEEYLDALKKSARWDDQINNCDYYEITTAILEAHHRMLEKNYNGGWN